MKQSGVPSRHDFPSEHLCKVGGGIDWDSIALEQLVSLNGQKTEDLAKSWMISAHSTERTMR